MKYSEFIKAARLGKIDIIQQGLDFIKTNKIKDSTTLTDINQNNKQSNNALDAAVRAGKVKVVKLLLDNGASTMNGSLNQNAIKNLEIFDMCVKAFGMKRMIPDLSFLYDFEKEKNWNTIVYVLKHKETTNETRVKFLGSIANRGTFEEAKFVYDLCDDISIRDNQLAAGIFDINRNFNFGSHKFKDERVKEMIITDEKVQAKAIELNQIDLFPQSVKDLFLF